MYDRFIPVPRLVFLRLFSGRCSEKRCFFTTVTQRAVEYRDLSQHQDIYLMLQLYCPGRQVGLPYHHRMAEIPIDEMNLSVRSTNALMRANARTFERVMEIMQMEDGFKKIRNLGIKSEKEIVRNFFSACYANLSQGEQAAFWQKVIENYKTYDFLNFLHS